MEEETLAPVRSDLLATGWSALVAAAVVVAGGIGALGWEAATAVAATLVGAVVFGPAQFYWDLRERLPRGEVLDAPLAERIGRPRRWWTPREAPFEGLLMLGVVAGLTWLVGTESETAAFAGPGLLVGLAAASFVAAALVARWERRTGKLLLSAGEDDLYARLRL